MTKTKGYSQRIYTLAAIQSALTVVERTGRRLVKTCQKQRFFRCDFRLPLAATIAEICSLVKTSDQ